MIKNPTFERRADLMEFIEINAISSKTDLAKSLNISRPTLYRLLKKLDVNDKRMAELFEKSTEKTASVEGQLASIYGEFDIETGRYKGQDLALINGRDLYRNHKGMMKPLPQMTSKGVIFCNWMHSGERYTVKKSDLIYMIENGINRIPNGFRTSADGKLLHRIRTKESDMVLVDKLEQADDAELIRLVKAYFGK